jgi:hypothetical protein
LTEKKTKINICTNIEENDGPKYELKALRIPIKRIEM